MAESRRNRKGALCVTFVAGMVVAQVWAGEPTDFEEFLARARERGMSELAEADLRTIAQIISGETMVTFARTEAGVYATTYQSGFCARPGVDRAELARLREELSTRTEEALLRVKKIADKDQSGFVSSEEGTRLRDTVVFGLLVAHVVEAGVSSRPEVARAVGLKSVEELERRVADSNIASRLCAENGVPLFAEVVLPAGERSD